MSKTTFACVVVNMVLAYSCTVTSYPNVQSESNIKQVSNTRTNSILKPFENAETNAAFLFHTIFAFISHECSMIDLGIQSPFLKHSMEPMFDRLIFAYSGSLAEIRIPQYSFYYTFSDESSYLEIKLTDIYLRHFDTVSINKLKYDLCKLSSEIDIELPKLEIAASYTLVGEIDHFPIMGNGDFILNGDSIKYYEKSHINNCKSHIFSSDDCDLANMNVTTDVGAQEIKVTVSGFEYGDHCENEVNQELNNYISEYLKSDKTELKRILADMTYKYIMDMGNMMVLDPLKMYTKMKEASNRFRFY